MRNHKIIIPTYDVELDIKTPSDVSQYRDWFWSAIDNIDKLLEISRELDAIQEEAALQDAANIEQAFYCKDDLDENVEEYKEFRNGQEIREYRIIDNIPNGGTFEWLNDWDCEFGR